MNYPSPKIKMSLSTINRLAIYIHNTYTRVQPKQYKKIITTTNQTKERKYNDRQNKTTRDIQQKYNTL